MNVALSLWGYEIDGKTLIISICAYLVLSVFLIVVIPRRAVPIHLREDNDGNAIDLTPDERAKIIDMRAKIRAAVTQVTGGVLVLATFIGTLQTLRGTEDAFNQKKADLFATNVKKLLAPDDKDNNDATRSEAIYVLQFVARSDRSYHLQGADFSGAALKGANFDGAAISRVSFRGVTGLEPRQLEKACVGSAEMTRADVMCEQPYFLMIS